MNAPPSTAPRRRRRLTALRAMLAVGFVVALWIPLFQQATSILPELPLGGAEQKAKPVVLTLRTAFDGTYAQAFEARYNQTFGWRPMLIRAANQFRYSVFGQTPRGSGSPVTLGRQGWLYENAYIRHHVGRAGRAEPTAGDALTAHLRAIQTALAARGVGFAIVISPSKPALYPEYLPDEVRTPPAGTPPSGYDVVVPKLRSAGLPLVDAQALFGEWRRDQAEPLFASTGTHWNYVGAFRTLQTILGTWRAQLGAQIPQPTADGIVYGSPRGADDDLARLLNLYRFGGRDAQRIPFPTIHPDPAPGVRPLRVGLVGDSFSFTLVDCLALSGSASEVTLMYYAKRRYSYALGPDERGQLQNHALRAGKPIDAATFDWAGWLQSCDAVLIECNATMVLDEFWGFAEHAARQLAPTNAPATR